MEEFKKHEEELGFVMLMIDGKRMLKKTRDIIAENEVTIPVLIDTSRYSREKLSTMFTPTTFIVDASGRIRCRLVGHSEDFAEIMEDVLSRI